MSSKLTTSCPSRSRARRNRLSARSGSARPEERGDARARTRIEFQRRGGDDAERALGAEEQAFEIVPGIVFAQLGERVDHRAVGDDRLDAGREVASVAVGEHRDAARIGRKRAPDRGRSFGGERQRKQAVDALRRRLRLGKRHPRLDHHRVVERVDLANFFHARQRKHDRVSARVRGLSAHEAGVAALRRHRNFRRRADFHHLGNL